jgi:hypothetical protein
MAFLCNCRTCITFKTRSVSLPSSFFVSAVEKKKLKELRKEKYVAQLVRDIFSLKTTTKLAMMGTIAFMMEGR